MKFLILIFIPIMILSSCAKQEDNSNASPSQAVERTAYIEKVIIPEEKEDLVYKNESFGYELTFSESWLGYYTIVEYSNEQVSVNFFGDSMTGQGYTKHGGQYGISMFQIIKKPEQPEGVVGKIGEVDGVEYYLAKMGGYPAGILNQVQDPDARYIFPFEFDEKELELVKRDWAKVQKMEKDIDEIAKTFKAIE